MKYYQIMMAALAVVVSFASCSSSGDDETPTYVEPTYTQHEDPQWEDPASGDSGSTTGGSSSATPYPGDMTAYVQLPDSLKAYMSNADKLAAFCGSECRGVASRPANDEVWLIRIYGNVGDEITLKYYRADKKYIYDSVEPKIVLSNDSHLGTYDDPVTIFMKVEE